MVRVPVTEAKWSTWKRYCDTAGISMGRAIMALVERELVSAFGDSSGNDSPVFAQQAEQELPQAWHEWCAPRGWPVVPGALVAPQAMLMLPQAMLTRRA